MKPPKIFVGIDIGSTTVKAVVVDACTREILWKDYQRHETKQPEKVLYFLKKIESEFADMHRDQMRVFLTGSGAMSISELVGGRFVQEVTAVCLAAEKLYPDVGSVIDLGGQDSKIIIFKDNPGTGKKQKIPSMNDKCAGGTGAVLDKINAKLSLSPEDLARQQYDGVKLHPVAGKCGVFAETDINSLQKQGVNTSELMASLFEAIVLQNLTVLTRGHTLRPRVLLIGGPNNYIDGIQQAWKHHITKIWQERDYLLPETSNPKDLVHTPDNALYFAAIGAVEFGLDEEEHREYLGWKELDHYIHKGRLRFKAGAEKGLVDNAKELEDFRKKYAPSPFIPTQFEKGEKVQAFIGLDVGSTSTKAVLLSLDKKVLTKSYQLSKGNPIEDTKNVLNKLHKAVHDSGAHLEILGLVTTGYAKDVLKDVLCADSAVVETVAHAKSALHFYDKVDVICDIGGQDIKIMILKDGKVKDFELNTQCSAGNGYFLQSTAESFGIPVEQYADVAFNAKIAPTFSYGCAVFLQSDIVNFQRLGWKREEILAGLARVLPKNVWLYVAQIPNFAKIGTHFVLQGGTQNNLAAVKAQVDFIESRYEGKDESPVIRVHEHCGESGAIGAALEALKLWENGRKTSSFIGLDATQGINYETTCDEATRCNFCKNKCLRTFIDLEIDEDSRFIHIDNILTKGITGNGVEKKTMLTNSKENGFRKNGKFRRVIVGNFCEKGSVEDLESMKEIKQHLDSTIKSTPNLVNVALKELFKSYSPDLAKTKSGNNIFGKRVSSKVDRSKLRIGIPRVLLIYSLAPLFKAYFESLGIKSGKIVLSEFTSEKLYKEGGKRGAIDPCYPSKIALSHVHNLLFNKHNDSALDMIFYPMIGDLDSGLKNMVGTWVCPSVVPSGEAVKAAFIKEKDLFAERGIQYVNPFLNMADMRLFEQQMFETFSDILSLTRRENKIAVAEGYKALEQYRANMRSRSREVLDRIEKQNEIAIVLLGRPYHKDPGINHEIFDEFQKLGYPILAQDILPTDEASLEYLFGEEVREGVIDHPLEITDVWKRSLSTNVNIKLWATKFVARHPNLVAIELSNFKCGHDAPTYTVIEEIIEFSGTPYFSFKDLDENKPKGSIKLRIETIDYFLKQHREMKFSEAHQTIA